MELGCPVGFVNVHMFLQRVYSLRPWKSSLKLSTVSDNQIKEKTFYLQYHFRVVVLTACLFQSCSVDIFKSSESNFSTYLFIFIYIYIRVYTLKDDLRHGLQMI